MSKLLTVRNLVVEVPVRNIKIIDDISFSLEAGQTLGLVGESGCGKSMTCYAVADMLPRGIARTSGSVDLRTRSRPEVPARQPIRQSR